MSNPARKLRREREREQRRDTSVVLYAPGVLTNLEAVRVAIRTEGCTCKPDITVEGIYAHVQHDDWCALLRKRDVN